jgi:F420H(2)-dependent quinone reductase
LRCRVVWNWSAGRAPAEELDDTARAELWPKLVAEAPQLGEFQARITRQIPVFMLTHQD